MVIKNAQNTLFFADADQMAITATTFTHIITEGTTLISDLEEFEED